MRFLKIVVLFLMCSIFCTQEEYLVRQVPVLRELKHVLARRKKYGEMPDYPPLSGQSPYCRSQTNSFLQVDMVDPENRSYYNFIFETYGDLINKILKRECRYSLDHFVFYHGQSKELLVVQDIIREIEAWAHLTLSKTSFTKMRTIPEEFEQLTVRDFLEREDPYKNFPLGQRAFDKDERIRKNLLSVNLSLFGGGSMGESSWDYFLGGFGGAVDYHRMIEDVFDKYNLNRIYIRELEQLFNEFGVGDEGVLRQIFIPINEVNQYVYLCIPFGYPILLDNSRGTSAEKSDYSKLLNVKEVLESYVNEPETFNNKYGKFNITMEDLQARIVISPQFLSHTSGIKIFSYDRMPEEQRTAFNNRLKEIVQRVFQDFLVRQREVQPEEQETRIGRLAKLMREHPRFSTIEVPSEIQRSPQAAKEVQRPTSVVSSAVQYVRYPSGWEGYIIQGTDGQWYYWDTFEKKWRSF